MSLSRIWSRRRRLVWVPVVALGLMGCDDDPTQPTGTADIVDVVVANAQVGTLGAAVVEAGLADALRGDGPFTLFAPLNPAFDDLGSDLVSALLEPANADLLRSILTYHVVAGVAAQSGSLTDGQEVTTLQGDALSIGVSGSGVTVGGASVIQADVSASNGVIHFIDGVLVPATDLVDTGVLNGFFTLVDLVRTAGLESTLRSDNGGAGFTVFAPTEEAFAALSAVPTGSDLVDVLTYHVVPATVLSSDLTDGQVVTTVQGATFTVNIDGASGAVTLTDGSGATINVIATDVSATNGVVHVIDGVLLPS